MAVNLSTYPKRIQVILGPYWSSGPGKSVEGHKEDDLVCLTIDDNNTNQNQVVYTGGGVRITFAQDSRDYGVWQGEGSAVINYLYNIMEVGVNVCVFNPGPSITYQISIPDSCVGYSLGNVQINTFGQNIPNPNITSGTEEIGTFLNECRISDFISSCMNPPGDFGPQECFAARHGINVCDDPTDRPKHNFASVWFGNDQYGSGWPLMFKSLAVSGCPGIYYFTPTIGVEEDDGSGRLSIGGSVPIISSVWSYTGSGGLLLDGQVRTNHPVLSAQGSLIIGGTSPASQNAYAFSPAHFYYSVQLLGGEVSAEVRTANFIYVATGGLNGFTDSFNRTDSSNLGYSWTEEIDNWRILDNAAVVFPFTESSPAILVQSSPFGNNSNYFVSSNIKTNFATPLRSPGVVGRWIDNDSFYGLYLNQSNSKLELYRRDPGVFTSPGQGGVGNKTINTGSFASQITVVLGSAWDGFYGLSEDDVITLNVGSLTSTFTFYSEDGTSTANTSTNRIRIRLTASGSTEGSIGISADGVYFYPGTTGTENPPNTYFINLDGAYSVYFGTAGSIQYHLGNNTDTSYTFQDVFCNNNQYTSGWNDRVFKSIAPLGETSVNCGGEGTFTLISDADITIIPNSTHNIRLEMLGNRLSGFFDNVLVINSTDSTYTAAGRGGLSYK